MGSPGHSSKLLTIVGVWLLAAVLVLAMYVPSCKSPERDAPPLKDQSIPELVAHLRAEGLTFRVVPTREGKSVARNAFLTTTKQGWKELNRLPKRYQDIASWRGTLFVEENRPGEDLSVRTQHWGDCWLSAGPFLFFGDPELLAHVRRIVGKPNPEP